MILMNTTFCLNQLTVGMWQHARRFYLPDNKFYIGNYFLEISIISFLSRF